MLESIKPHIADLRKRLFYSLLAIGIAFFACFSVYEPILDWMMIPAKAVLAEGSQMVAIEVQETFFTALKVAFFSALLVTLPNTLWQIWLFLEPALLDSEKQFVVPFILSGTFMFFIGASFAYYIVVPFGFDFLINFGNQVVTVMPSIGKYVTFFTKLLFGFGIAFELPVFTYLLAKSGLLTDQSLKDFFKYAVILIFVLSALLTPPDVLTQFLMAGPLLILYGISIYIAKVVNPAATDDEIEEQEEMEDIRN